MFIIKAEEKHQQSAIQHPNSFKMKKYNNNNDRQVKTKSAHNPDKFQIRFKKK